MTNGFGLAYEYRRGGYTLLALGLPTTAAAPGRAWGQPGDYDPDQRTYEKYSASFSKDFFFAAVHKVHLNAAYFGGQPSGPLQPVPVRSLRRQPHPRRAVDRVSASASSAWCAPGTRSTCSTSTASISSSIRPWAGNRATESWKSVTGLGLGFNLRGPFGTLLRGEVGKSFLPSSLNGAGSFVAQVTILKPL